MDLGKMGYGGGWKQDCTGSFIFNKFNGVWADPEHLRHFTLGRGEKSA